MSSPSPAHRHVALILLALAALTGACAPAPLPSPAPTTASSPASARPEATQAPASAAAPAASASPTEPADTPLPATAALLEALTLLEPANDTIMFTDWAELKRATGSEGVTGTAAGQAKVNALGTEHPLSDAWLSSSGAHRADWGFDAFDLAWEASGASIDGILHVLRCSDPAVPLNLLSRLDALGYAGEQQPRGVLRTGSLADIAGRATPSLALTSAAVLDDGLTVVASSNPDLVRAVLASGPVTPESDAAVAAAALIIDPTSAILLSDDPCTAITEALLSSRQERDGPSFAEQLANVGTLGHPEVVAVSYGTGASVTGRVVLTYPDAAAAMADLEPRGILARAGSGIARPLADVQTVVDARLEGASIVIDLEPPAGEQATRGFARRLMTAVMVRDMVYAACTP